MLPSAIRDSARSCRAPPGQMSARTWGDSSTLMGGPRAALKTFVGGEKKGNEDLASGRCITASC